MSQTIESAVRYDVMRQTVARFVRAINDGDLRAAFDRVAPYAIHRTRASRCDHDSSRQLFATLLRVFPDLDLQIRDQTVDGDMVVSRVLATGTHLGSFLGRRPSGLVVAWQSVDTAEVDPDHAWVVRRHWDLWTSPELFGVLGFIPASRGS